MRSQMQDVMESRLVMPWTSASLNGQDSTQGTPLGDESKMKGKEELTFQTRLGTTLGTQRM